MSSEFKNVEVAPVGLEILGLALRDEQQTLFIEHNVTRVQGQIDMEKFSNAFQTIISRHDALRTGFTLDMATGSIQAHVQETCNGSTVVNVDVVTNHDEAVARIKECFKKPLKLNTPPLIRSNVIQVLGTDTSYIVISASHAIMDGTSCLLFNKELCMAYNEKRIPEIENQYSDFALWQKYHLDSRMSGKNGSMFGSSQRSLSILASLRRSLSRAFSMRGKKDKHKNSAEYNQAIKYYQKALKNMPEQMSYPTDFQKGVGGLGGQVFGKAGCVTIALDSSTCANLDAFIKTKSMHQSMWWSVILCGIFMMLRVYSSTDDSFVFIPRTCRPAHMKSVIGHFANEGIIRLNEKSHKMESMTLSKIVVWLFVELGQIAKHAQHILGSEILGVAKCRVGSVFSPQVTFTAIEKDWLQIPLDGVEAEPMEDFIALDKAYEDFYIRSFRGQDGLKIMMEYNADIFLEDTAMTMLSVVTEFIKEWLQTPEKKLRDLSCHSYFSSRTFWKSLPAISVVPSSSGIAPEHATVTVSDIGEFRTLERLYPSIEKMDVLVSGLLFCMPMISCAEYHVISCQSKHAPSGKYRWHLLNGQMKEGIETIADLIDEISRRRSLSCHHAIFSYNQQVSISGITRGDVQCSVALDETSAAHIFEMDQGIHMCLFIDDNGHIALKYDKTLFAPEESMLFVKGLKTFFTLSSEEPKTQLGQMQAYRSHFQRSLQDMQSSLNDGTVPVFL